MTIVLAATLLVSLSVTAVTAYFALELLAGLRPDHITSPGKSTGVRVAIVVPAHNEEGVIGQTISALREQASRGTAIFVVADNCTDRTAEIAHLAGATVIVRHEPDRRGKGFALAATREHLRNAPPDVVVVIDADCRIDRESLTALTSEVARTSQPCQAINLLAPDLRAPPLVQISSFAFMIKNLVRQRGLQRLAGRVHLTGTGMALPWDVFICADLGGSNVVEDLALGVDLADRAAMPRLVSQSTVLSPASSTRGTLVQRRRWEGGYLAVAMSTGPAALLRSLRRVDLEDFCAAFDLLVPPVALLVLANFVALVLGGLCVLVHGPAWPLFTQLAVGIFTAFVVAAAWLIEGRRFVSGRTLLFLPLYVLWKLPMYAGLVRRGAPKEWLRTGR